MAGDRLYITGMTGRAPDGSIAESDIRAQTRQSLKTIEEQLRKHGMTFANVVDSTVWLRHAHDLAAMNEVYREIVIPYPPACATVGIPPNSAEMLIEIMMLAVK
jgi:2-iminobutanoate/2-iminopropanoate deaminase